MPRKGRVGISKLNSLSKFDGFDNSKACFDSYKEAQNFPMTIFDRKIAP